MHVPLRAKRTEHFENMLQGATHMTLLDALVAAVRDAADFNRHEMAPPAAILWTDPMREWSGVLPELRSVMPELLTLGDYDGASRTGPAIWCKAVVGGAAAHGVEMPEKAVPVVYMPGIAKEQVRGVDGCPSELKPVVELQYRGVLWTQLNGKDWTVRAFLSSADGGLGLRIARDAETSASLLAALPRLLAEEVAGLRGREIDAADLRQLIAPDPISTLLQWMGNPVGTRAKLDAAQWLAFCGECKQTFGFDPQTADATKAGEQLAGRKGAWGKVWARFTEAPRNYAGVVEALRRSKPAGVLFAENEQYTFPQDNEQAERSLREALLALAGKAEQPAREAVLELEAKHAPRRETVWATLGEAPLAFAVQHLADAAKRSTRPLAGASLDDAVSAYASDGWKADAAVILALAAAKSQPDQQAVGAAARAVYAEWLNKSATAFQQLTEGGYPVTQGETLEGPGVVLFADGLRLDIGRMLEAELLRRGLDVEFATRLAAIPTATPTAKPAVSPASGLFSGDLDAGDFACTITATGKALNSDSFKRQLPEVGFASLGPAETPNVSKKYWTEFGTLDRRGHSEQSKLASLVEAEVQGLADRVVWLLDSGMPVIKVVTDHGWLLLPGGLPKAELPKYPVDSRWSRCASVKPDSSVKQPTLPWRWNNLVQIASPPGAASFRAGEEYAHGGISPQECITPVLTVRRTGGSGVHIASVEWKGLMARVTVSGGEAGMTFDVRLDAALAATSLREADSKAELVPGQVGRVYLSDDAAAAHAGAAVEVVVLDRSGAVVCRFRTTIPA